MASALFFLCFLAFFSFSTLIHAKIPGDFTSSSWQSGHTTFYGGSDASGTMGDACGYGNLDSQGDGGVVNTAALASALFNKPLSGGGCFEIKCADDSQWCHPGSPTIVITATNFCHSDFSQLSDNGGWCNSPHPHFELAMPMFLKIADYRAGKVTVDFRRSVFRNRNSNRRVNQLREGWANWGICGQSTGGALCNI